jgi:hypothetical protein
MPSSADDRGKKRRKLSHKDSLKALAKKTKEKTLGKTSPSPDKKTRRPTADDDDDDTSLAAGAAGPAAEGGSATVTYTTFEKLGVADWLRRQAAAVGMATPTPVQVSCIPAILKGLRRSLALHVGHPHRQLRAGSVRVEPGFI